MSGERKRLSQAEEIVRLIGQADEPAGKSADATVQADRLLALLLDLQIEVDRAFLRVALDFDGFVGFDAVEVIELIQPEDADFPCPLVEQRPFIKQKFAPDDFIAGRCVTGEIDSPDVVLLLFVEAQRNVDYFLHVVNVEFRLGREVDEAEAAILAGVIFQRFAKLVDVQNVALLEGKERFQCVNFEGQLLVWISADDFQRAHHVAIAFFDRNGDVDGLAVRFAENQRNAEAIVASIEVLDDWPVGRYERAEITVILIEAADADFEVFVQLVAVIRLGHHGNECEVERDAVGPIVAHGTSQFAIAEGMIAGEFDLADFDLGAFLNFENQDDGVARCNAFILRGDFCKLVAVFPEQFAQHYFRFLDFRRIELTLNREPDLPFLEAVENVGFRHGVDPVIADAADHRPLFHFKDNDFGIRVVGGIFHSQLNIFEELCVP